MRNTRTAEDWKVLRRAAAELLHEGMTITEVSRRRDVNMSSVKRSRKAFQEGGLAPLAPKRSTSRGLRLSPEQIERLRESIISGPLPPGVDTDLWTCPSIAEVARREFGISYDSDHLGRILNELGFSPQKPQRRARERDEAAIEHGPRHD